MLKTIARALCAAALIVAAGAVVLAGPLTARAAVSILPLPLDLPAFLLSIAG